MVKINQAVSKKDLNKISNATNIFNLMKSEIRKNPDEKKLILDFEDIKTCSKHVFKKIFELMQKNLEGQYMVEVVNGSPAVVANFKMAISNK